MAIDPIIKRRYNLTYRLRKKGFEVDTKLKSIYVYRDKAGVIEMDCKTLHALASDYQYSIQQNPQLKIQF